MIRLKYTLLILICFALIGCAALFTEQEYRLIDQSISEKIVAYGVVYSIPEKANIRKIVLLGIGRVQNIAIAVRDDKNKWKPVTRIKRAIKFPFEIPLVAETDAIKVSHYSVMGRGRINTIQLYTLAGKYPTKSKSQNH